MRTPVLWAALAFTTLLAYLTLHVAVNDGVSVLTLFALLVLALFAFGIIGALRHPPEE